MSDEDDYIRAHLPGAPAEAIRQLAAYHRFHQQFMADPKRHDFDALLVMLEEYLAIVKCWAPENFEREIKRIIDNFGRTICKGNQACIEQFETTIRKLVAD